MSNEIMVLKKVLEERREKLTDLDINQNCLQAREDFTDLFQVVRMKDEALNALS